MGAKLRRDVVQMERLFAPGGQKGSDMKQQRSMVLAVALFALSTSVAMAQFGGRGGMRGMNNGGGLQMLRLPEVQKELKLTPEQIALIDVKQQEVRDAVQALYPGGFGQMTPEERQQRMAKTQDLQDKAVADILGLRFHQLELQQQGPVAITRKSVADELKLTADQQKQVADIQTQTNSDRRAAMQGMNFQNMSDDDRQKLRTKMQDTQKAESDKLLAVLTDAQKTQWKAMQGTPFTFPAPAKP